MTAKLRCTDEGGEKLCRYNAESLMCVLVVASQGRNGGLSRKVLAAAGACLRAHRDHAEVTPLPRRSSCCNSCNLLADTLLILQWGRASLVPAQQAADVLLAQASRGHSLPLLHWPLRMLVYSGQLQRAHAVALHAARCKTAELAAELADTPSVRRWVWEEHDGRGGCGWRAGMNVGDKAWQSRQKWHKMRCG